MKKDTEDSFAELAEKAAAVYEENFPPETWFGRCIFLSWYCDLGTCKFCFRSTTKHKFRHAESAKRSTAAILADAIIGKNMGWRIEFLTGGYRIFSFEEQTEMCKLVSSVYGHKIWINLGTIDEERLSRIEKYVEGVCASIETVEPVLHDKICPDKQIEPYSEMLKSAKKLGLKTSMTIVIGLGEKKSDFSLLAEFIESHKLDRITFYALKPVQGTPYTKSPEPPDYAWWIAKTRIRFPKLEIIAGLTPRNAERYAGLLLRAGANALTKFPALKRFGSPQALEIERQAEAAGRVFKGTLTSMPDVDWDAEVDKLNLEPTLAMEVKARVNECIQRIKTGNIPDGE
jgi:biotin synthase-like enzyme